MPSIAQLRFGENLSIKMYYLKLEISNFPWIRLRFNVLKWNVFKLQVHNTTIHSVDNHFEHLSSFAKYVCSYSSVSGYISFTGGVCVVTLFCAVGSSSPPLFWVLPLWMHYFRIQFLLPLFLPSSLLPWMPAFPIMVHRTTVIVTSRHVTPAPGPASSYVHWCIIFILIRV